MSGLLVRSVGEEGAKWNGNCATLCRVSRDANLARAGAFFAGRGYTPCSIDGVQTGRIVGTLVIRQPASGASPLLTSTSPRGPASTDSAAHPTLFRAETTAFRVIDGWYSLLATTCRVQCVMSHQQQQPRLLSTRGPCASASIRPSVCASVAGPTQARARTVHPGGLLAGLRNPPEPASASFLPGQTLWMDCALWPAMKQGRAARLLREWYVRHRWQPGRRATR
jgi:hypothetical protein